jgi:hypothetical protein
MAQPSQETRDNVAKIFVDMGTERERIVNYVVNVKVDKEDKSKTDSSANVSSILVFEYSKFDEFRLAYRLGNDNNTGKTKIDQLSGEFLHTQILHYRGRVTIEDAEIDPRRPLEVDGYFDVRALGLGLPGDFTLGRPFEEVLQAQMSWTANDSFLGLERQKEKTVVKFGQARVTVDTKHGLWPVDTYFYDNSTEHTDAAWSISTVEEKKEIFVPKKATLRLGPRNGPTRITYNLTFEWIKLNDAPVTGMERMQELAIEYGLKVEDFRRSQDNIQNIK